MSANDQRRGFAMDSGPCPQGERRSKISLKKFGVSAPLRFCGLYVKKRPLSQKVSFFTTEAQRSGNAEFFNAFALPMPQYVPIPPHYGALLNKSRPP
jgi:hypothetical protein